MSSTSTLEVWIFILRESANESHPLDQVKSPIYYTRQGTKETDLFVIPGEAHACRDAGGRAMQEQLPSGEPDKSHGALNARRAAHRASVASHPDVYLQSVTGFRHAPE